MLDLKVRDRAMYIYKAIIPSFSSERLNKKLQGKILKNSLLCTYRFRAYIKFEQGHDLIHEIFDVAAGVQAIEKNYTF
jgi:hypothetical protein